MAYWNQRSSYSVDKPVLAFTDGVSCPFSVTVTDEFVAANEEGRKVVAEGHFVSRHGTDFRFLPRSLVVTTAFGTGSAVGVVANPRLFKAGDVIRGYNVTDRTAATVAVGTIASVNYVTGQITLEANATTAVALGNAVGVVPDEVLGLYVHSLDFTDQPRKHIAVCTKANGVYRNVLPYYDDHLAAQFEQELMIREKF